MTEEDFIFAWVLVARAGSSVVWTQAKTHHVIENAKRAYKQIKESANEIDSRTED